MFAQNVYVNVKGGNMQDKQIRLACIDDRISLCEKNLKTVLCTEDELNADLNVTLDGIKEMILKINMHEYHFLARPGNKYSIEVLPYNDSVFLFSVKEVLPVRFFSEKDDGINRQTEDADTLLNGFLAENYRLLSIKDSSVVADFDKFEKQLMKKYKDNEYMLSYIKYEFASVRYGLSLTSRLKIKEELFKNSPVLYDNIGYMDCFNTVFSHYFSQGYKFIGRNDIENWLDGVNYNAFNDALGRDKILENEIFREMVFLKGMRDAFTEGVFPRDRILKMIDKFASSTKFPEHKQIAANLKEYLSKKDFKGGKTTDLKVKNINSEVVTLSDYNDRPLVLCFVQLDCTACLKELETVHFYYDSIKENCNVAVVCFDNSFEKMYNFVNNTRVGSKYKFDFLYFDRNWELAEEFKLHFFPAFVLLNTDGTVARNPMDSPSRGSLKQFMNKKQ